jgi:hypothetical protein
MLELIYIGYFDYLLQPYTDKPDVRSCDSDMVAARAEAERLAAILCEDRAKF